MRILFFLFLSIHLMGQTPPRVTFKQLQKDTLTGSIAISGVDSNLTYSRNFYVSADSFLILYGDTVGQGSLNAILVDGVTILGDGVSTNLSADTNLIKDIIGAMVNAGLGIDVSYDNINKELLIESLSLEDSVYNGTASQIDKGTPLYAVGVQGNYWSVAPADAGDIGKLPVVAIAGENIAPGTEGLALIKGHIKGVNTSTFSAGDEVYVAVGGGYTNVKPKGESNYVQYLGTVVKSDANGSGIINLGEVESNLNPGRIFIGGADSTITRVTLKDSISSVIGDSLASNVVRSITAGTFLSGGTITNSGTIALDTASAGLKTYIGENIGTVDLTSQVTGTLPVANGGTGATTLTSGAFLKGNGTSAVSGSSNLTETADTVFVAKYLNVDTSTLFVDADKNLIFLKTNTDTTFFHNKVVSGTDGKNIFIGNGGFNIIGAGNTFDASYNVSLGSNTLGSLTTGNSNLAFGYNVLNNVTTGGQNVGLGKDALRDLKNGLNNLAIGALSMRDLTSGNNNIGLGFQTLVVATGINQNVAIGGRALFKSQSNNNVAIGYDAAFQGADSLTGADNTFIGYNTGFSVRTITNATAIGANTSLAQSNTVILGNSADVGIRTSTPAYTLDVVGDINASGEVRNSGVILTSDARYKKDINSIQNATYKLKELNPVSYYWNELMLDNLKNSQSKTKDKIKYGLVAQEVELYFPEFVSEGADGFKAIDYQAIISLLIKGWQEQQQIIETQQQEIETLKTQYNDLLQRIINLENK